MPPHQGQEGLFIEIAYTLLIVLLCFIVYWKTKEIYDLSRYKGISYFRNAFLFFGLAYAFRFFLYLLMLGVFTLERKQIFREFMPFSILIVGYFSTMAILYLTSSLAWKKLRTDNFIIWANITAVIVSVVTFAFRSHQILMLFQLFLIAYSVIMIYLKKTFTKIRMLYLLLLIFWLLNLFSIGPRWMLEFEIKLALQLISTTVFILITYKVFRWAR